MTVLRNAAVAAAILAAVGCGTPAPQPVEDGPLTVDQWKAMPANTKYSVDTFERLKKAEPKLQEPPAWEKFHREVVAPARKKDKQ